MELTAIILAGGKSSRMGRDKGLIDYRGKPMVEYAIDACKKHTDLIFISTNNEQYATFGYPLIPDNHKEVGPIGGLEAGLARSATNDNIVCPCDMPNVQPEMFEAVLKKKKGKKAVVLESEQGKIIPVFGYYSKRALSEIQHQINTGNYKMLSLLQILIAETVVFSSEKLLSNFNYPEDIL